jgi:hypothetical protein
MMKMIRTRKILRGRGSIRKNRGKGYTAWEIGSTTHQEPDQELEPANTTSNHDQASAEGNNEPLLTMATVDQESPLLRAKISAESPNRGWKRAIADTNSDRR